MASSALFLVLVLVLGLSSALGEYPGFGFGSTKKFEERDRKFPKPWEYDDGSGRKVFAACDADTEKYHFFITSEAGPVGAVVYLNTDRNLDTGAKVFEQVGYEYKLTLTQNSYALEDESMEQVQSSGDVEFIDNEYGKGLLFTVEKSVIGYPDAIDFAIQLTDSGGVSYLPNSFSEDLYTVYAYLPERDNPDEKRVAIVFSEISKNTMWAGTKNQGQNYYQFYMSMQNQVRQSGVPFDMIYVEDLLDLDVIKKYDALVFPYMAQVDESILPALKDNLFIAVYYYGTGIITSGDFMTNDANGDPLPGNSYAISEELLGIRLYDFASNVYKNKIIAENVDHPMMTGGKFVEGETIANQNNGAGVFILAYEKASGVPFQATTVFKQQVQTSPSDSPITRNAVIAVDTSYSRNVHFSTIEVMGNFNFVWLAVRWSVYGDNNAVDSINPAPALRMGRHSSLFVSRNDMDLSRYPDLVDSVHVPLLEKYLKPWKADYNFVGSYYINTGDKPDDPDEPEYTDWDVMRPLYQKYLDLGNEIGSHSVSHPYNISNLSESELDYQFKSSIAMIAQELGLEESELGAAQPGNPEDVKTGKYLATFLPYFSGGYSGIGAGLPGAFGYFEPNITSMVYIAPNMLFDFTMIQFYGWDSNTSKEYWAKQFELATQHGALPIVHWPWHDYAPDDVDNLGYTSDMLESTIKLAYDSDAEFITGKELENRIRAYYDASLSCQDLGEPGKFKLDVSLSDPEKESLGSFALYIGSATIQSVESWYAYSKEAIFLTKQGGSFIVRSNAYGQQDDITRIHGLPMRAELKSVTGDGNSLFFSFQGEGKVVVKLSSLLASTSANVQCETVSSYSQSNEDLLLYFDAYDEHYVSINAGEGGPYLTHQPTAHYPSHEPTHHKQHPWPTYAPTFAPTFSPTFAPTTRPSPEKEPTPAPVESPAPKPGDEIQCYVCVQDPTTIQSGNDSATVLRNYTYGDPSYSELGCAKACSEDQYCNAYVYKGFQEKTCILYEMEEIVSAHTEICDPKPFCQDYNCDSYGVCPKSKSDEGLFTEGVDGSSSKSAVVAGVMVPLLLVALAAGFIIYRQRQKGMTLSDVKHLTVGRMI